MTKTFGATEQGDRRSEHDPSATDLPDIFPLAPVQCLQGERSASTTASERRRCINEVNETISGLNWLAGAGRRPYAWPVDLAAQSRVAAHVESLVCDRRPTEDAPTPEAALSALLSGKSVYECSSSQTTVAPFREGAVSLPELAGGTASLIDLVPPRARGHLEGDLQRMMANARDAVIDVGEEVLFAGYHDPALGGRRYSRFLRQDRRLGLVRFTLFP